MQYLFHRVMLVVMVVQISSAWSCTKVMRWNEDPPFSFAHPDKPEYVQGISVDIARAILSEMDCTLHLEKMPWARALVSLQLGTVDILYGAYNTPDRRKYAHFSSQPEYSPNILFIRKADKATWSFQSLEEIIPTTFRLGVQINVTYSHEYDVLREQPEFEKHLHENSSRISLWQMLFLNRIDGVIADKYTGLIELSELGLNDHITATSLLISNEPSFFAFSKKTTSLEFVAAFDAILSRLRHDGEIEKIETRYLQKLSKRMF